MNFIVFLKILLFHRYFLPSFKKGTNTLGTVFDDKKSSTHAIKIIIKTRRVFVLRAYVVLDD